MKKVIKILAAILVLVVVVAAGLLAWVRHDLRENGERIRARYARELERIRTPFLEDQEVARRFPILQPRKGLRDAGPFLNPRIGWDGERAIIDRWVAALPDRPQLLALPKTLVDTIPDEWWRTDPARWAGLDFTWMTTLRSYDYWDVETNSPWRSAGSPWPNGFPMVFELTPWVKLRLAKGLSERRTAEAVVEVEHLAALLVSTETLVGASLALQYLGFVDQALTIHAPREGAPAHAGRMDVATQRRARRAIMAAQDFLRVETPVALREVEMSIVAGRCAALNEALHAAILTKALQRAEDAPALRWLEQTMKAETTCRMPWVREAWHDPAYIEPRLLEGTCDDSWLCRAVHSIGFTRALAAEFSAEILHQISLANYARHPAYP